MHHCFWLLNYFDRNDGILPCPSLVGVLPGPWGKTPILNFEVAQIYAFFTHLDPSQTNDVLVE